MVGEAPELKFVAKNSEPTRHRESPAPASPRTLRQDIPGDEDFVFVAESDVMREVRRQVRQIADFDIPVLLLGESGTGKGVVAHMIHALSCRRRSTFMKVNCAALPTELLESELFGHEAGAFTGAMRAKPGKFEACDTGTILLDEVGDIPFGLQAKLLHVLQDGEFSRLGSTVSTKVDVRIIAATNRDLGEAISNARFREDLYYRLNTYTIVLPPLRERPEDVPALMVYFMALWAKKFKRPQLAYSQKALDTCLEYSWPGNIRELESFVRRYLVLEDEMRALSQLGLLHSNTGNGQIQKRGSNGNGTTPRDLKSQVRGLKKTAEREAILQALIARGGNQKKAAQMLNISVRALQYKIRDFEPAEADEMVPSGKKGRPFGAL